MTTAGLTISAALVDGRIDLAIRVVPEEGAFAFVQTTVSVPTSAEMTTFHRALELALGHPAGLLGQQARGGIDAQLAHPESLAALNAAGAVGEVLRLLIDGLVRERVRAATFHVKPTLPDDETAAC